MAEPLAPARRPEALIAAIEQSRRAISRDAGTLRHRLNPGLRLREAVQQQSGAWIGGALAAGFVAAKLSGLFSRPRTSPRAPSPRASKRPSPSEPGAPVPRGIALVSMGFALFRFLYPFLKPLIVKLVSERLQRLSRDLQRDAP